MNRRGLNRPATGLLVAFGVVIGLAACRSSDATKDSVVPSIPAAAVAVPATAEAPTTTVPATTLPAPTEVTPPLAEAPTTTDNILVVTDEEVADLEKQLDEIDQLLAGVDADLSQD